MRGTRRGIALPGKFLDEARVFFCSLLFFINSYFVSRPLNPYYLSVNSSTNHLPLFPRLNPPLRIHFNKSTNLHKTPVVLAQRRPEQRRRTLALLAPAARPPRGRSAPRNHADATRIGDTTLESLPRQTYCRLTFCIYDSAARICNTDAEVHERCCRSLPLATGVVSLFEFPGLAETLARSSN